MICETCHAAMSARLDGEDAGVNDKAIEAHLAGCAGCRHWLLTATRLTRRVRVAPAEPVPDLTAAIMAGFPAGRAEVATSPAGASSWRAVVLRLALAGVAVLQVALAVVLALVDHMHVGHEVAAWNLALGLGLAAVAWQVRRAGGLLPLLAGLVVAMTAVEIVDATRHGVQPAVLAAHSLLAVALLLVWLLIRETGADGGDGAGVRVGDGLAGPRRAPERGSPITRPGGPVPAAGRLIAA